MHNTIENFSPRQCPNLYMVRPVTPSYFAFMELEDFKILFGNFIYQSQLMRKTLCMDNIIFAVLSFLLFFMGKRFGEYNLH